MDDIIEFIQDWCMMLVSRNYVRVSALHSMWARLGKVLYLYVRVLSPNSVWTRLGKVLYLYVRVLALTSV